MLDFIYDKVPLDEIWYQYLTSEWRIEHPTASKIFTNFEYLLYKISPGKPTVLSLVCQWRDLVAAF